MATVQQDQYIEMTVGGENYAIKIEDIHEIIKMQAVTDLPHSKFYVKGIINLRGMVVPVVSLRNMFGMTDEAYTKATRIVVVHHQEEAVGIIVDQVNKVTTYPEVQPPPVQMGSVNGAFFSGIGLRGQHLVGILKLDEVLLQE